MQPLSIGQSVPRVEDFRFLQGMGRYTADIGVAGETRMHVIRSPHARARIKSIDASAALAAPGVLAVLTGKDVAKDGLGTLGVWARSTGRDGKPNPLPPYRLLALDFANFVGEGVAIVIAETIGQAADAADLVEIDYEPLPAVVEARAALAEGAPKVWDDLPDNLCFLAKLGKAEAADAAFAKAAHVARVEQVITRIIAAPMETRVAVGHYDRLEDRYTLYASTQGPNLARASIAGLLSLPESQIRVVSPDVGGAFGLKGMPQPEQGLVVWASKRIGRPVKWISGRSEAFLGDQHARDNFAVSELALDENGKFLALRVRNLVNLGAYVSATGIGCGIGNIGGLAGVYVLPAIGVEVQGVFTNTSPTSAYRGAGRPEASLMVERVIDVAAGELGIDPAELRRRNLIPDSAMPYNTGFMFTYDSGEFDKNQSNAEAMADWAGFAARRAEAADRGKLRGIGMAHVIEIAANLPHEMADLRFHPSGKATLIVGTHNHGQGHETTYRQILGEMLGLDPSDVRVTYGDSDQLGFAMGTGGSRSMVIGAGMIKEVSDRIIAKGKRLAAHLMEAEPDQIEFDDGTFRATGSNRAMTLKEVAQASFVPPNLPAGMTIGLMEQTTFRNSAPTFPNGCHICEVEIAPETGEIEIVGYWVVDDVGRMVNPMIVKGQMHGGIVQGLGQVFAERIVYDEDGQLVTGSFMDYQMPRAAMFPMIEVESNEVPTPTNPFGIKGAGESGTVGGLAAGVNAVCNALAPLGIKHFDMPASPERVWRAIAGARGD
jgi:carbon-monoxide dehydrogenase large subunit